MWLLKNPGIPMSEPKSLYFTYQERDNPEALLAMTRSIRRQIHKLFDRSPSLVNQDEVFGLLERCEAVFTLLEHEVWLNLDDGK